MVNAMHEAALPGSMSGAAEQDAGSSIPVSADTGVSEDSEDAASIQFGPSDFLSVESASNVAASDMAMNPSAPQTGTQAGDMAMNPSRKAKPRRKVLLEGKQGKKQHTTGTTPEVKSPDRKAERTYVRQKRKLSSLEKCSGPATEQTSSGGAECAATCRTASVRRRLQFEIGEKGVQGDQSSAANSCHHVEEKLIHAKISSCSATTILSTAQSGHGLHVDMDNSADGLVFYMIRINNEVLDEYIHWPEIAPDTTQQISTATSGCCSREPTREHDKLVITHDLDATSMGVAITEGNGKDLDLSLLAEGVTDHNVHKYQRTRIKLKSLSQLNDHTVLSTPATFMDRTITKICMRTSGSEKIGTLQNEETPARKPKPRRKKHRAKVIREKKHDSTVTTPEVKSPNKKAKRSYVRKKRNLSYLEKCSSRTASVRRRLQFEIGEQDLDATSMGVTITEGKNTDMEVNYSNKDDFDMHRSATLAFGPAGGVKNKRSVRVRRKSFVPIMDIEMNNAQTSTRCLKIMTKKRSPRGRPHSHSPVQSNMDKKNMFSPGKVSSGGSNRSKVSYGKFQQASRLAPKKRKNNLDQMENEMHPSLTTSAVVSFGATSGLSNSLVAFGGQLIFPYERPLDLVKKQSPRAKVDLDFETTRVWNLLMGKVTKPLDGTDVDKDRWWNQEREVFHGRAKSFIARMRLVQGDRHFSPWKGSVVDSVVGVFLTQNVSDHLSSSAYMALSASFPPGSVNSSCKDDITSQDTELIISKNYPPRNCVGGIIGAASQQLGTNFDSSLARNDATTKELECQVELHCNKRATFEASDLQEHASLSTTGGTIAETAKGVNGFTSYNGVLDKAAQASRPKKIRTTNKKDAEKIDWDKFRRQACDNGHMKERIFERRDSVDWEAVRCADVHKISHAIWQRGLSNILAERIQSFLNRLVRDHGSIDLEWLRDIPPDSAKDYLLSIRGLGLKSVECVRLLSLHHVAFPVDTNVGRICVRLGWVPIQPLPESLQLHLLELYPVLETIQKYLWPRLCKLDQHTLYELHYHMITFGKVFCTKSKPNCNACPLRSECRHFASAFASARLALPAPEAKGLVYSSNEFNFHNGGMPTPNSTVLPQLEGSNHGRDFPTNNSETIIEEPASPIVEERLETVENDIEDYDADTGV